MQKLKRNLKQALNPYQVILLLGMGVGLMTQAHAALGRPDCPVSSRAILNCKVIDSDSNDAFEAETIKGALLCEENGETKLSVIEKGGKTAESHAAPKVKVQGVYRYGYFEGELGQFLIPNKDLSVRNSDGSNARLVKTYASGQSSFETPLALSCN